MISKIKKFSNIYIAPYNDISIELNNYLISKGIKVDFYLDSFKKGEDINSPKKMNYTKNSIVIIFSPIYCFQIYKNVKHISNKVIFVQKVNGEYLFFRSQRSLKIYNFLSKIKKGLVLRIKKYFSPISLYFFENERKLLEFKNKHGNQRAILIGNGPSLKMEDLELLKNEITFAANKIFLAFDEIKWRPTYYMIEDFLVMKQNFDNVKKHEFNQSFFPSYFLDDYSRIENAIYFPLYQKKTEEIQQFASTPFPTFYSGATVVYTMIQLAIFMGFKELYLIGMDFSFKTPKNVGNDKVIKDEGAKNHFHKDYRQKEEKWFMPNLKRQEEAFSLALKYANKNGIKIYNATRGGKLEVFPRVSFDKIFKKTF